MKITTSMLHRNFLRETNMNQVRIEELQLELATGKKVAKPSDDAFTTATILSLTDSKSRLEQYQRNIASAELYLERTDAVLADVNDLLVRAKELAAQGASETTNPTDRAAIAVEVDELRQQLVALANSSHNNKFIFSGTETETLPFTVGVGGAVTYNGNNDRVQVQVTDADFVESNIPGDTVFQSTVDIFQVFSDLSTELNADNTPGIAAQLAQLELSETQISEARTEIGAIMQRTQESDDRHASDEVSLASRISKEGDADLAESISELVQEETAVRATLAIFPRITQTNLLDFMA
ncbi:MAG: flagellar hook-associated protein FlgL [Candidatus Schekmanbacteria bacterium]|nr:flagellar hook-associated protein FlgL [Candidatus Schekmanbacteria bacterium]